MILIYIGCKCSLVGVTRAQLILSLFLTLIFISTLLQDLLPDNHSAIIIDDFKSPKELAKYLRYLNENDKEYEKYLEWKKTGITNENLKTMMASRIWSIVDTDHHGQTNYIDAFECFLCQRIQENRKNIRSGKKPVQYRANKEHVSCPEPFSYDADFNKNSAASSWSADYKMKQYEAKAVRYFHDKNYDINAGELHAKVSELYHKDNRWF